MSLAAVTREFRRMLDDGVRLMPSGDARRHPESLVTLGYLPRYKIELFGTVFYLTRPRKNPDVRFFVAYVLPPPSVPGGGGPNDRRMYPRLFYKDLSLIWRAASHLVANDGEYWIGKGDVRTVVERGEEHEASDESTTDLPYEMQTAIERINAAQRRVLYDDDAPHLVLRNAPHGRIEPYAEFTAPRRAAAAQPGRRIHGGRPIARFTRKNDPTSLKFVAGYEPDFDRVIERATTRSRLYGGRIRRFRFVSRNRRIQYLFLHGPRHTWIVPPQTLETDLSTFGLRLTDVNADEDLFVPGYEYHYWEDETDPPTLVSQIPESYVGAQAPFDETRADASAWLDALPVIREFRNRIGAKP